MKKPDSAIRNRQSAIECWLPDMDLNHDKQIQSLLCYRYTIGQAGACDRLKSFIGQSSCQTIVPQGQKTIARGFNRGLAFPFGQSPAGAKEMCVFDARPHPGPLPRGEGEAVPISRILGRHSCGRCPTVIRAGNRTIISDFHVAGNRGTILPLLPSSLRFDATKNMNRAVAQRRRVGERAGTRADVTTNFSESRVTFHACRAEAQRRRISRN